MELTPDGDTLGLGAFVDDIAEVLETIASGVVTRAASPWASEWAGKLEVAPGPDVRCHPRGASVCGGRLHVRHPRL